MQPGDLKEMSRLSREEASARLRAIADELARNDDLVMEWKHPRSAEQCPGRVDLKLEFEIEDDSGGLVIERTWLSGAFEVSAASSNSGMDQADTPTTREAGRRRGWHRLWF